MRGFVGRWGRVGRIEEWGCTMGMDVGWVERVFFTRRSGKIEVLLVYWPIEELGAE